MLALQSAPVAPATPRVILESSLRSRRVAESSGVAVSRSHRGLLWTHNDSGDGPYVYATDVNGSDRGTVHIRHARAVDWEDIALGPCPASRGICLYIADTGDNDQRRKFAVVYTVPEPDPPANPSDTARSHPASALRLRYPGGPEDVEAIYVSPLDGALYLVSKGRRGSVALYRVARTAWGSDTTVTAALVQRLPIDPFPAFGRLVTGAAVRSDGRLVAVRTYTQIYFFVPSAGGRLAPSARPVCNVAGLEIQGEGVAFLDDSTLVLTSEGGKRTPASLHVVRCP